MPRHLTAPRLASALAGLLLAGCAAPPLQPTAAPAARAEVDKRLGEAVVAPLTDLNLVRATIPPALATAQKSPYRVPSDLSCAALGSEIESLDAALGADLDTAATAANPSLIERGTDAATDAVIGAVRNTTEGVIPFRGWVRKVTGAERYAKDVSAAIAAGTIRRAYLKGLGQAAGCPQPAAPRRPAEASR